MKYVMIHGEERLRPFMRDALVRRLPFPAKRYASTIKWFAGDKRSALRRNEIAAAVCSALIVVEGAPYATAVVRKFRHRGRRIFYFSKARFVEVDIHPRVTDSISRMGKEATWEPTLWAEALQAKRERADAYVPFNYDSLFSLIFHRTSGCDRCVALLSMFSREEVDATIPARNWNERFDDAEFTDLNPNDIMARGERVTLRDE